MTFFNLQKTKFITKTISMKGNDNWEKVGVFMKKDMTLK